MEEKTRKYPRITVELPVRFREESDGRPASEYRDAQAIDLSPGGMFISAKKPLPVDSIVGIVFEAGPGPHRTNSIAVRGLVRWVHRWKHPRGMGMEFIEFSGTGKQDYADWLTELATSGRAEAGSLSE